MVPVKEPGPQDSELLTRQQAAELLTDVAYALITGGLLAVDGDRDVRGPVADEVLLKRQSGSDDGRVQLELKLSWSTVQAER